MKGIHFLIEPRPCQVHPWLPEDIQQQQAGTHRPSAAQTIQRPGSSRQAAGLTLNIFPSSVTAAPPLLAPSQLLFFFFLATSCGMWDLVPQPGIEAVSPALDVWTL